jgi:hypothetical protein
VFPSCMFGNREKRRRRKKKKNEYWVLFFFICLVYKLQREGRWKEKFIQFTLSNAIEYRHNTLSKQEYRHNTFTIILSW